MRVHDDATGAGRVRSRVKRAHVADHQVSGFKSLHRKWWSMGVFAQRTSSSSVSTGDRDIHVGIRRN